MLLKKINKKKTNAILQRLAIQKTKLLFKLSMFTNSLRLYLIKCFSNVLFFWRSPESKVILIHVKAE